MPTHKKYLYTHAYTLDYAHASGVEVSLQFKPQVKGLYLAYAHTSGVEQEFLYQAYTHKSKGLSYTHISGLAYSPEDVS